MYNWYTKNSVETIFHLEIVENSTNNYKESANTELNKILKKKDWHRIFL